MTLDRTIAPPIRQIDHFSISTPERTIMPNGTPLNIIQVGSEDVVRLDLLIKGGQWNQTQLTGYVYQPHAARRNSVFVVITNC